MIYLAVDWRVAGSLARRTTAVMALQMIGYSSKNLDLKNHPCYY